MGGGSHRCLGDSRHSLVISHSSLASQMPAGFYKRSFIALGSRPQEPGSCPSLFSEKALCPRPPSRPSPWGARLGSILGAVSAASTDCA